MEPKAHTHGTNAFVPHEFLVQGRRQGAEKVHNGRDEVIEGRYLCASHTRDGARKAFTETYWAAGVRGVTVDVLYLARRLS